MVAPLPAYRTQTRMLTAQRPYLRQLVVKPTLAFNLVALGNSMFSNEVHHLDRLCENRNARVVRDML